MQERITTAETPEEFNAIAHLRGWCHNMDECPICRARQQGKEEGERQAIDKVASGE